MWYFLSQKVDGKMIFADYWKVLVLNFSVMGNMVFFEARSWWKRWYLLITEKFLFWTFRWWEIRSFFESRSWWKDDIYWLLRSSCFELFGDGKYDLFFSQKVDGKMITWSFLAFHDSPGLGKYGFSCSDHVKKCFEIFWKVFQKSRLSLWSTFCVPSCYNHSTTRLKQIVSLANFVLNWNQTTHLL